MTAGGARRFVVEADGGSRGNPGPAAYGALVRDADGEVLAEVAEHIGRATNNVAEYRGLIAGLEAARDLDPGARIEVRMDSKLVVEQMSGRWKVKHPDMQPLALRARRVLPPEQVSYTWVPRERNKAADRLANEALDLAAKGLPWQPSGRPLPAAGLPGAAVDEAQPAPAPGPALAAAAVEALAPPTRLVLLRHGRTGDTARHVFSGWGGADPALSEDGEREAALAAQALSAPRWGIDAVVASPMRRTRQTAQAVADALGLQVRLDEGWREQSFGEWEGLTFGEVRERSPEALTTWLSSPAERPPGGESLDEASARVALARDELVARHTGRTVLVVAHLTPLLQLVRMALDAPAPTVFRLALEPASVSRVDVYTDGLATLRLLNDTSHLA
ncbi:bifunctional RNase H/acid phosphatase [Vallicoccus soli]|uniref:Bifunctional RNase H/acid phosphatase n=1 Tax=Vallicoccus soli TaxID=2339232 RepID=A0A3A3Z5H7_9ACTN|nr:bifunctional RNase H/acid phosphatase [Vallicoccus soli]RJK96968.1 bifunctional RNase H/acid phosphatase [Vallicoccus soli]